MRKNDQFCRHLQIDTGSTDRLCISHIHWYKSDFNARRRHHSLTYWIDFAEEPLQSKLRQAQKTNDSIYGGCHTTGD